MAFNYYLGRTLDEIQFWYGFNDKEKEIIRKTLKEEGFSELSICYIATKYRDKLTMYVHDDRFVSIFINKVRTNAYKTGDPRWNNTKKH